MSLKNYDFEEAHFGTTYDAVEFQFPEEDEFYLVGAKIIMQLRKKPGQVVVAEFSTENGKMLITGDYSFEFPTQEIYVAPDTYWYDILFIFPGGRRDRMFGGLFPICPTISYHKP